MILTEEEITNALRPLFSSDDAFSMALSMSMDEYRAIEAAVIAKLQADPVAKLALSTQGGIQVTADYGVMRYGEEFDVYRHPAPVQQQPVAAKKMMQWVDYLKRQSNNGAHMSIPSGLSAGTCMELACEIEQFIKAAPVQQEPDYKTALDEWWGKTEWVQETAKSRELGMHRADVLKQRIVELEAQKAMLVDALRMLHVAIRVSYPEYDSGDWLDMIETALAAVEGEQ